MDNYKYVTYTHGFQYFSIFHPSKSPALPSLPGTECIFLLISVLLYWEREGWLCSMSRFHFCGPADFASEASQNSWKVQSRRFDKVELAISKHDEALIENTENMFALTWARLFSQQCLCLRPFSPWALRNAWLALLPGGVDTIQTHPGLGDTH